MMIVFGINFVDPFRGGAINQKWKFYHTIITPFRAGAMMIAFGINFVDPSEGEAINN